MIRDYLRTPEENKEEIVALARDLLQILNTNSEPHQLMAVYFLTKIANAYGEIIKQLPELGGRYFGQYGVILLNPFVLKSECGLEKLRHLKKLSEIQPGPKARILLLPLEEFLQPDFAYFCQDLKNDIGVMGQISADFNKEVSFEPVLKNLVLLVKGVRWRHSETKMSARVVQRSLLNRAQKDGDSSYGGKAVSHSSSFELDNEQSVIGQIRVNRIDFAELPQEVWERF